MNAAGIQNAAVGFALFDSWLAGMKKLDRVLNPPASPLVDAAFRAFDNYVQLAEVGHNALIAATGLQLTMYNQAGLITRQGMAPFLALNILA